jgi:hypothetical protein
MLSVMAHGDGVEGARIAGALLPAITALDEEPSRFYLDLLLQSVNQVTRQALEAMMKGYEYKSDFARKYVAQGVAEGEARALLTVLRGRGMAVSDAARDRILAEQDPGKLERWLEKAGTAATVAELLDEPS